MYYLIMADQPIPNPSETQQTYISKPKKTWPLYIVITLLIIILLTVLASAGWVLLGPASPRFFNNRIVSLPVNLTNPSILRAYITYEFRGKVTAISQQDNQEVLVTSIINNGDYLKFLIEPHTLILIYETSEPKPGTISDLKQNQNIDVVGQYSFKDAAWTAKAILINKFATSSSTIRK
jgi:hypothetical protein